MSEPTTDALPGLVAGARRWDDHLPGCGMWRHETERVGQLLICSGRDTLDVDEDCTCGYEEFRAALALLDRGDETSAAVKSGPEPSAVTFEVRHRELRDVEVATRPKSLGLSAEHVTAFKALSEFRDATGPLVDDLVAAVRRDVRCRTLRVEPPGGCGQCEGCRLRMQIAALDEEAAR